MTQVRKRLVVITVSNSEGPALKSQSRDQLRFSWIYSIPKANYRDNISNEVTTASFHIPSISLFTNDPITQSYTV